MSRDFTPRDLYLVDKDFVSKDASSLRDMKISMVCLQGDKEIEIPMIDPQARANYPELSFLLDGFDTMYQKNHKKEACKVYTAFETALKAVEEQLERGEYPKKENLDAEHLLEVPIPVVVQEWFYGRLDPAFYYSTYNSQYLRDYLSCKLTEDKENKQTYER